MHKLVVEKRARGMRYELAPGRNAWSVLTYHTGTVVEWVVKVLTVLHKLCSTERWNHLLSLTWTNTAPRGLILSALVAS